MFGKVDLGPLDGFPEIVQTLVDQQLVHSLGVSDIITLPFLSRRSCRARSLREVELERSTTRKASRSPALTWSHGIPSMIGGQYRGMEGEGGWLISERVVKWARNAVIRVLCGELVCIPPFNSHGRLFVLDTPQPPFGKYCASGFL